MINVVEKWDSTAEMLIFFHLKHQNDIWNNQNRISSYVSTVTF